MSLKDLKLKAQIKEYRKCIKETKLQEKNAEENAEKLKTAIDLKRQKLLKMKNQETVRLNKLKVNCN